MIEPNPKKNRGLLFTALCIAVIGAGIVYALMLQQQTTSIRTLTLVASAATIMGSGLCLICATAQFWMKH